MNKYLVSVLSCFAAALMLFAGCDSTETAVEGDPKTAAEKSTQAYTEMENLFSSSGDITNKNFSNVEKLYAEAVAADPTNPTANFGAAFSHLLVTMSDTAIRNTLNRWEGTAKNTPSAMLKFGIPTGAGDMTVPTRVLGTNLMKIIQTAKSDPPTITEMQNLMRDRILPRINYAIARLAVVEQNPSFELRISGKMQGSPGRADVYLDMTEVYVMEAMLYGIKSSVEQFLVFKFELASYSTKAAVAALQQNSTTFFVLAPDGAARAQSVKGSLVSAVTKLRSAVTFLKNETDEQNNDIIKRGTGGMPLDAIDTMIVYLNKVETALTGTFTIDVKDADSDGNDYTISVSLNNFYNNLPQNPKSAWLPAYTLDTTAHGDILFRWVGQEYATFNFPDPTFSGLFPGMTNDKLKRLLYIDKEFSWQLSVNLNDANGTMGSSHSLKVVVNNITYLPKMSEHNNSDPGYRYYNFYIPTGDQMTPTIIAVVNGVDIPLQYYQNSPKVRLKNSDFVFADITIAPQNIVAQYGQSSINIVLQQYAIYQMERSVNNGPFAVLTTAYRSSYQDGSVAAKTTYAYRALRISSYYYFNAPYTAMRPNNYTNTVTVTTP
jgi:hypothetical protein